MTIEEIQKSTEFQTLIAECTAYDYKVMLEESRPKSWLKSVSAFANTMGGSLFFGIDNDGNVKGLEDIQHVTETISMKIRDYMDPLPDVEMIPLEQEGKHVLQLKVKEGLSGQVAGQVKDSVRRLILALGDKSLTRKQIMELLSLKGRDNFRVNYLEPSMEEGIVLKLYPDSDNRPDQAYYLTEKGLQLWSELK